MRVSAVPDRPGTVRRLALDPPTVPAELLLRLVKYKNLARVPPPIWEAARQVAAEAGRLAAPEAVLWRGPVAAEPDGVVTLAGTARLRSRVLARMLATSREAFVLVLTVGPAIEERARVMLEARLLLEGFLMDTAGWAAIELTVRGIRLRLREEERRHGRSVTHRLGPGHCDWLLEEQMTLIALFGDAPLPVTLTDAACMQPCKSISAVYGIVAGERG